MDDPASFALMLAGAAPKTKSGADQHTDDQQPSAQDNKTADNPAAPQTAQAATTQMPAKPAKDSKTDDSSDPTVAQPLPDAAIDPSAVITVAMQPQPAQPVPTANNNDGDDTVDAAAATAPGLATPASQQVQTNQTNSVDTDTDADTAPAQADASKQTQQVQQAAQAQPVQPKPVAKAAKPVEATDKAAPRKPVTADAADGVKTAQAEPKTDTSAPQATAATTDAKAAPHTQQQAPDLTVASLAAPQAQGPVPQQDAAAQIGTLTQHIEVTAQPNVPALAVEIAAKSQSGAKQFDIRLDPPELGRVEVRLSIDATGKASAHLTADQPQTLDLLQKDSTNLTRALRDAGLDVSQDGLNFSLRQQGQDNARDGGFPNGSPRGRTTLCAVASSDATTNATSAYRAPLNGRLDIRV